MLGTSIYLSSDGKTYAGDRDRSTVRGSAGARARGEPPELHGGVQAVRGALAAGSECERAGGALGSALSEPEVQVSRRLTRQ